MVALKRRCSAAWSSRPSAKQERRGGIETSTYMKRSRLRARSRNAVVALKPCSDDHCANVGFGSRNAVVALKPPWDHHSNFPVLGKQERRGGIETVGSEGPDQIPGGRKQERRGGIETALSLPPGRGFWGGSRNAVVALKRPPGGSPGPGPHRKQERRGGIETPLRMGGRIQADREAGTPWWH